jgi:hypothetical protein
MFQAETDRQMGSRRRRWNDNSEEEDMPKSIQDTNTNDICLISQEEPFRDRIHELICDKILKSFSPFYSQ